MVRPWLLMQGEWRGGGPARCRRKNHKCKTPTLECSATKEGEGFWVVTQNKSEEQELNLSRS